MSDRPDARTIDELRTLERLPSPRGVALEVLRLSRRDDVSNAELARVIQADPAIAARIVRAANAATGPMRRPAVALADAILVLGLAATRTLALGFSLVADHRAGRCEGFDYPRFWSHSILRALSARALALRVRVAVAEEVFACGLLADIGRLALATLYPGPYAGLLAADPARAGRALALAERDTLGTDHVEIGNAMLADWGLPKPFVAALGARHEIEASGMAQGTREIALARVFHLADELVALADVPAAGRRGRYPRLLLAAAKLGVDGEGLERAFTEAGEAWPEWTQLLDLPTEPLDDIIESLATPVPQSAPAAGVAAGGLRVMIALAEPAAAGAVAAAIVAEGHAVSIVETADQALVESVDMRPDVVVIEAGPRERATLRTLRESAATRDAHLFAIAPDETDATVAALFEAGADDCFAAPPRPRLLAARLRTVARIAAQRAALARDISDMRRFASELALDNRKLQKAAFTDPLTGLPNRRYGMDRLAQEWAAAERSGAGLSCLIVDIDHFKAVNDARGHEGGDDVLRHVASILRGISRLQDVVCRIGGEEFMVICPATPAADAGAVADRLRRAVEQIPLPGAPVSVTVSVGAAARGAGVDSAQALLRRADEALFDAKRAGRNRVQVGTPP